jgi:hypothetical protein
MVVFTAKSSFILTTGAAEYADVTENVLKIAGPVLKALKEPMIQPYFRSLSVRVVFPLFLYPDPFL